MILQCWYIAIILFPWRLREKAHECKASLNLHSKNINKPIILHLFIWEDTYILMS